jgi:hypothetical protein
VNQTNGARGIWVNGKAVIPFDTAYQSLTDKSDSTVYRHFISPMYVAHDEGGEYDIYVDDVYIDDTLARVEIGDAPQWNDCTRRQIQMPTSWTAQAIEITVNLSGMGDQPVYLYVVDAAGTTNAQGYPLTPVAPAQEAKH